MGRLPGACKFLLRAAAAIHSGKMVSKSGHSLTPRIPTTNLEARVETVAGDAQALTTRMEGIEGDEPYSVKIPIHPLRLSYDLVDSHVIHKCHGSSTTVPASHGRVRSIQGRAGYTEG